MKRISLLLCFVLLVMAMFAISAFAATSKNVVKDATLAEDGGCGDASLEMIRDGDVNTAASCGSAASWVNFHFLYADGINVSKVVVVVNSTGNVYYDSEGVATSIKEYTELSELPNIYLRLYAGDSTVYKLENVAASNFVPVTNNEGNTLYTTYTFDLGGVVYSDITKVEIATVHGGSNEMGVWEVEIYDYNCVEEADHNYSAATCTTKATCAYCGETKGEVSTEHTWAEATCAAPKTCTVCGTTEGEADASKHIWKNASYTAPKTCKTCGATEGDVWVDSTLPNFVRGDEGDQITYEDIVGEVTLTDGSTTGAGSPENVLDGSVGAQSYWGGPTNSSIKITLKNEWEITEAKLILFSNWASLKVGFYAADGTLLGEKNIGGIQCNYAYFDGNAEANPTYTDYSAAISGLTYGDSDKAVKYILITNTGDKWGWVPGVVEVYFTGRERIPTACENHEFEEKIVVAPTCTEAGSKQNVCTICGAAEGLVSVPSLDHDFSEYRIKTPATCISAAVIEFECIRCGETIERATHVDDVTDYIDLNTVVTNGAGGWTSSTYAMFDNNNGTYLMASGEWYVQSEVALDMNYYISSVTIWTKNLQYYSTAGHTAWMIFYYKAPGSDEWVEGGKIPTPTRNSDIEYEYTLELAEPVYASAIKIFVGAEDGQPHGGGPGLGSYNGGVLEAKVAGSLFAETASAGHTWVASGDAVAPGCEDLGYTPYTCSVCQATKNSDFVRETGHSWVNATCTEPKTCSACSVTNGDPLGHDMSVTATCTTPLSCSRCDYTEGEALGHTWVDATCTTAKTCSVCSATEGEALGHTWVDATCTAPQTCSVCSVTEGEALGHQYFYPCDKVCMVCYETTNPDAAHTIVHVEAKAGTDCQTWDGNIEYWTCSDCGAAWTDEALTQMTNRMSIVANGAHNYVAGEPAEDGSVTYTCDTCGESYTESVEHTHTEVEIPAVPSYKDADKVVHPGKTSGVKCSECGEELVAPKDIDSKFYFVGNRLSLSDYVNVDYGISVPSDYTNVYVVYISDASDGEEIRVEYDGSGISTYRGIKMQNLGDNIYAIMYATTADGLTAAFVQESYSVRTYCVNQLGKSTDATFKTMLSDLLAAGAAAQIHANYKADQLVNAGSDIESLLTPSTYTSIDSAEDISSYIVIDETTRAYADFIGRNLSVGNAMAVQFLLTIAPDELDNITIEVSVDRSASNLGVVTYTYSMAEGNIEVYNAANNQYIIKLEDLKVIEYDAPITATILRNGEQISRQAVYSVNAYLQRNYNKGAQTMQDFLLAMYRYGASAFAYKNK